MRPLRQRIGARELSALLGKPTEGFCYGVARVTRSGDLVPTCQPVHIAELAKRRPTMIYPTTRRSILVGAAASLISAPAIVRAASLMPVRQVLIAANAISPKKPIYLGFAGTLAFHCMKKALERGWDEKIDGRTFGGISERQARNYVAYVKYHETLPGARVIGSIAVPEQRGTAPLNL
jgi:hypothetical protein